MHANKHSIYLYNCFLCNIFLLLQRYGEEKKKPPTEEEMLKIRAGADKKDWGGICAKYGFSNIRGILKKFKEMKKKVEVEVDL